MENTTTDERTVMEQRLDGLLNRVSDWLKYEETKNVALVTLNGVGVGAVLQLIGSAGRLSSFVLSGCLLFFLASLIVGLLSFYPMLDTDRLHERATKRRSLRTKERRKVYHNWKPNVVFFSDIAGAEQEEYLEDVRVAAHEDLANSTRLETDYASEIIANAELAVLKVSLFKIGFVLISIAIVALGAAVFVNQLSASVAKQ